jgi:hypothetical protein
MTGTLVRTTYAVRTPSERRLEDVLNIPLTFLRTAILGGIVPKCQCCCIQLLPTGSVPLVLEP